MSQDNRTSFLSNLFAGKRITAGQVVFWVITVALAIGAFSLTRNVFTCWKVTALPGAAPESCAGIAEPAATPDPNVTPDPNATPGAAVLPTPGSAVPLILPDPWDGASRITVLVIGLDYRDWEAGEGPPRSDTMILLTLDPLTKTAGMLSLPRDLWVNIPGYGYGKINTAYALGEGNRLPGGGPELARKTVEQFLGVPVQYFAQVDFLTFVRVIDEIGGVKVEIAERICIDPIGTDEDVCLDPGRYTLDGRLTLAYVRTRDTEGGDVDRANRQQQVMMSILDRLRDPAYFAEIITKAPSLYNELQSGVNTNMSLDDSLRLAVLVRDIRLGDIKRGVIDYEMVTIDSSPDGLYIFKPIPDRIRVLRDEIFTSAGPLSPMATGDLTTLAQTEAARLNLLNGAYVPGLASSTGDYLTSLGLNVVAVGNTGEYNRTVIVLHTGKPYTVAFLVQILKLQSAAQVVVDFDPAAASDIDIYLGYDWIQNKPFQ